MSTIAVGSSLRISHFRNIKINNLIESKILLTVEKVRSTQVQTTESDTVNQELEAF